MKTLVFIILSLAAGCGDGKTGGGMQQQPGGVCGNTSGALMGLPQGCHATAIDFMNMSRLTLTNVGFAGNEGNLGNVSIQLVSLVGMATYSMGPNVKSYSSMLTRSEDGRSYVLFYDSADKTKTLGTMTLQVTSLTPDPASTVELDVTAHFTATYVPPAGATYTDTVAVDLNF